MKTTKIVSGFLGLTMTFGIAIAGNAQAPYKIIDLNTGETVEVYYDETSYRTINRANTQPVDYYVVVYDDVALPADTVHGITGLIVNNMIRNKEGKWEFDDNKVKWDGEELKMKDKYGRKVKWEKGELKIKDWNSKYKSEKGDDAKYKQEWDKIKWKDDKVKVEAGPHKTKANVANQ